MCVLLKKRESIENDFVVTNIAIVDEHTLRDKIYEIRGANISPRFKPRGIKICDIGCGKGRYLKKLSVDCPDNEYYAADISVKVMQNIECVKEKRTGSLTCIPYNDNSFEFVYTCEAFEHAINLRGAFMELYRIVKPGGMLVIIDKPVEKLGQLEIYEWEQWIDDADIARFTVECGGSFEIEKSVSYENKDDGLFRAWIVRKS